MVEDLNYRDSSNSIGTWGQEPLSFEKLQERFAGYHPYIGDRKVKDGTLGARLGTGAQVDIWLGEATARIDINTNSSGAQNLIEAMKRIGYIPDSLLVAGEGGSVFAVSVGKRDEKSLDISGAWDVYYEGRNGGTASATPGFLAQLMNKLVPVRITKRRLEEYQARHLKVEDLVFADREVEGHIAAGTIYFTGESSQAEMPAQPQANNRNGSVDIRFTRILDREERSSREHPSIKKIIHKTPRRHR